MNLRRIFALSALLGLSACPKGNDANSIADQFVDAYYLEFNFDAALVFTSGMAKRRIENERQLASKVRATGALSGLKAKVYYDTPEHRSVREDLSHHTYTLETAVGTTLLSNRVLVMTTKKDGKWEVIAFREMDRPRPRENPEAATGNKPGDGVDIGSRVGTTTTSTTNEVRP